MIHKIYLGSGSPRRVELLQQMNIPFTQRVLDVDELYPEDLSDVEITDFLAKLKGKVQQQKLALNELALTADTIVWHNNIALGKPKNEDEAIEMLIALSGETHQVITSVCLSTKDKQRCINDTTHVTMTALSQDEITYYIRKFKPFDKAGAYGIQEWIGRVGVSRIEGSYTNVVGLPTHKTYALLKPYIVNL
ncbi:MAG: Maf family nucleotide pyrophosphatase [Flavobacteriaceae bacterium]|nr:Maf family nucleotide pyrophosphatase [Flavobacteriaceae bacterium]